MDVTLALLADSANISREGKLNLLGIFHAIFIKSFPAVHPSMHLVMNFEASNLESGRTKEIEVVFSGPDGNKLGSIAGKFVVPKGEAGYPIQWGHIISLPPIKFDKPGDYAFNIMIGGEHRKPGVPLRVMPAKQSK